jgi:predicted permease
MSLYQDFRLAIRRWVDRPAFAVTAIVTLALGIGATTAIFSVVHAVLLKPLPWRNPDELVSVYVARPHWRETPVLAGSWNVGNLSWPIFRDLQTKSRTLVEVGTWSRQRLTLNGERNEQVHALRVSAGFLPLLGVNPLIGRFFTAAEDESPTSAVLVSYEAWQRRFGGSPSVLGQEVSLNETAWTVVGVLPPGFDFFGVNPAEFLLPFGNIPLGDRHAGNHFMNGVARLRANVPLEAAQAEADPLVRGAEKQEEKQARLVPLAEDQLGRSRRPLMVLLSASGLLLLIACANVAGLLLGEAGSRRYEMSVRLALGASRRAVARQMFVESLALAGVAMLLAVVLVAWMTPLLVSLAPTDLPRAGTAGISLPVLGFGLFAGIATAVIFGMAPALAFARVDPARWMYGGSRGAGRTRFRAHNIVVASEVALAVSLVVAASLFGETLLRLTSQPVGFRPDDLVVAGLRFPRVSAATEQERLTRNEELLARLKALPGVDAAAVASTAPFSDSYGSNTITIDGKPELKAETNRHVVSEEYFRTLQIPIVRGRGFDASDVAGGYAAVVTQEFERRYLDGDALGKRFTLNGNVHRVIGVVPATKHRRLSDDAGPAMYILNRQVPQWTTSYVVVRTAMDGGGMLATIRRAIESFDPRTSIVTLDTMSDLMRRSVAEERYRATLSLAFGGTALMLAAMGLYGLIGRMVTDRRREIGVRLALGAQRSAVVRLVLRQAALLVAAGLIAGIPAALAGSSAVSTLLYGVTPTGAHTFVLATAVLAAAGLAAGLIPAIRASHTDPAIALRAE